MSKRLRKSYGSELEERLDVQRDEHRQRSRQLTDAFQALDALKITIPEFVKWRRDIASAELKRKESSLLLILAIMQNNPDTDDQQRIRLQEVSTALEQDRQELKVLNKQERGLSDDLEHEFTKDKRRRVETGLDITVDDMTSSYWNTLARRVTAQAPRSESFDQPQCKKDALKYYGVQSEENEELLWCTVSKGHYRAKEIKAAHIVPKMLFDAEVSALFGEDTNFRSDVRNCLFMHNSLEGAFDRGKIVFRPEPKKDGELDEFRVVLVNEHMINDTAIQIFHEGPSRKGKGNNEIIRYQQLIDEPLKFLNDNRPGKRYLFLMFFTSFVRACDEHDLWLKRRAQKGINDNATSGFEKFIKEVREDTRFWPTPGKWVDKSLLQTTARIVSWLDLPESILSHTITQSDEATSRELKPDTALHGTMCAATMLGRIPHLVGATERTLANMERLRVEDDADAGRSEPHN